MRLNPLPSLAFLCPAVLAVVPACNDPGGPVSGVHAVIGVAAPTTRGQTGLPVEWNVELRNAGEPARIQVACCGSSFEITVTSEAGAEYRLNPPVACACPEHFETLATGGKFVESGEFDGRLYDGEGQEILAGTGTYTVHFRKTLEARPGVTGDATGEITVDWEMIPRTEAELVRAFEAALGDRNAGAVAALLHPDFAFVHDAGLGDGAISWSRDDFEAVIRRMFDRTGDLVHVDMSLRPVTPPDPRPEFLRSPANPEGLDPARWTATGFLVHSIGFFDTRGDTDYRVDSFPDFVLAQDQAREPGTDGRFLLYRWIDRNGAPKPGGGVAVTTWTDLFLMYARGAAAGD